MTSPKDGSAGSHDDNRDKSDEAIERVADTLSAMFRRVSGDGTPDKTPERKSAPLPAEHDNFFKAVRTGKVALVAEFLAQGVHPDIFDKTGDTALLMCARAGLLQVADILLSHGANPLLMAKDGKKLPIEEALNFGKTEMVKLLTSRGGYAQGIFTDGRSLFHRACEKGKTDVVKALMDAGADGNERTENGATPLIIAVQTRQIDVADVLLDDVKVAAGMNLLHADADDLRRSAFQLAVEKGSARTVGKMLAQGAFVNLRDASGETPLMRAIAQGNLALIETLVRAGADLNREDAPLVFACLTPELRSEPRRGEVVALLIRLGADPDQRDAESGMTPLHAAALAKDGKAAMETLLRSKANPNTYDNDGFTPLFYTLHKSSDDMMKTLVKAGADINAPHRQDGRTVLIQAVREKSYAATGALLKAGANPRLVDGHGKSALSYAREDRQVLIAALLEKEMASDKKPYAQKPANDEQPQTDSAKRDTFKGWKF